MIDDKIVWGELILVERGAGRVQQFGPLLGIFAEIFLHRSHPVDFRRSSQFLVFAERPVSLEESLTLPSGLVVPAFKFYQKNKNNIPDSNKWGISTNCIKAVYVGRDRIVKRLTVDKEHRYDAHAKVIEQMQPPYIRPIDS